MKNYEDLIKLIQKVATGMNNYSNIRNNGNLGKSISGMLIGNAIEKHGEETYKSSVNISEGMNNIAKAINTLAAAVENQSPKEINEVKPPNNIYTPIESLGLSPRTLNALLLADILTTEKLKDYSEIKLRQLKGIGNKAMLELRDYIY